MVCKISWLPGILDNGESRLPSVLDTRESFYCFWFTFKPLLLLLLWSNTHSKHCLHNSNDDYTNTYVYVCKIFFTQVFLIGTTVSRTLWSQYRIQIKFDQIRNYLNWDQEKLFNEKYQSLNIFWERSFNEYIKRNLVIFKEIFYCFFYLIRKCGGGKIS